MKQKLLISIFGAAVLLSASLPVFAAIVPCTTGCKICDLLKLVQNIITFLIEVSIPLATAMILGGGLIILTSGGSESRLELGKTILTNAVVGFAIVMASWMIINTILNLLANSSEIPKPWNVIQC